MNIPRRRIRVFDRELRFFPEDGWTEELLDSCLTRGEVTFNGRYYHLQPTLAAVSYFDEHRLYDLSNYVTDSMGEECDERRAKQLIVWYGSSNIFKYGESANGKRGRHGR